MAMPRIGWFNRVLPVEPKKAESLPKLKMPPSVALVAAAEDAFGRTPDEVWDDHVRIDDITFVYLREPAPRFVLQPECERCNTHDVESFPLETWSVLGVQVEGQALTVCRNCRFILAASSGPLRIQS
jgi:hypothetical protein